jgi:trigger factor
MLVAEVVRGKALALVLEAATVTDASGNAVDLKALDAEMAAAIEGLAPEGDDHEGHDHDDHEGHDHA